MTGARCDSLVRMQGQGPVLGLLALLAAGAESSRADRLGVSGDGMRFEFRGKPLFLSGANQPWLDYGNDFGNNQTNGKHCALLESIANVSAAGGNAMRFWLFVEGASIPAFDSAGKVVGTDKGNSLIRELQSYLQYAASKNVFVILTLWNGAVLRNQNAVDLFTDPGGLTLAVVLLDPKLPAYTTRYAPKYACRSPGSKLQSYLDTVVTPLATALAGYSALGGYELMNEPEGSLLLSQDSSQPCFDTQSILGNTGAGWAGHHFTMEQILHFFSAHASAIKAADPQALVTVGSWSEHTITSAFPLVNGQGYRAYYSDSCLTAASSAPGSTAVALDFAQVHTYPSAWGPALNHSKPLSPFTVDAAAYVVKKPLVIGEFGASKAGVSPATMFEYAHANHYAGAWDWSLIGGDGNDDAATILAGLKALKDAPDVAVNIGGTPPFDSCSCSDKPPPGGYSCAQQASWGKCDVKVNPWMKGFCCKSCFACRDCT